MVDTSTAARKAGVKNIWVTNGYISNKALERLCDVIDAANIMPCVQERGHQDRGYTILANHVDKGKCKFCNEPISGRWT